MCVRVYRGEYIRSDLRRGGIDLASVQLIASAAFSRVIIVVVCDETVMVFFFFFKLVAQLHLVSVIYSFVCIVKEEVLNREEDRQTYIRRQREKSRSADNHARAQSALLYEPPTGSPHLRHIVVTSPRYILTEWE